MNAPANLRMWESYQQRDAARRGYEHAAENMRALTGGQTA